VSGIDAPGVFAGQNQFQPQLDIFLKAEKDPKNA
jgi:hypothetical protein